MTLRVCLDCTTGFAVGIRLCPHCGSERSAEQGTAAAIGVHARGRVEEDTMPKITRHGGPSDRADIKPEPEAPAAEGGEEPSAGNSSETSTEKPSTTPETSAPETPKRVRTTGSRSRKARMADSSASSTAGDPETAGSETDSAADGGDG